MSDGEVLFIARVDDGEISDGLDNAVKKVGGKESAFMGIGKKLGAALAAGFSLKAVFKFGTEFEQGMANASTLFGDANVSMEELNKNILNISNSSGVAAIDLTDAFTTALSSGIPATDDMSEALGFLEKSTKLAKSGFTSLDTVVDVTTTILNSYGKDVSETAKIHEVLQKTQDYGKTTVDQLGSSLANVIPSAAAAGISFEEIGAALSIMTAAGTPTAQATTQLNAAINAFMRPNKEMTEGLQSSVRNLIENGELTGENADMYMRLTDEMKKTAYAMGNVDQSTKEGKKEYDALKKTLGDLEDAQADLTGEFGMSILQSKGLQGALELLNDGVDGSTNKMAKALGSTEALKASFQITGANADQFRVYLKEMGEESDTVDAAYQKVTDTVGMKFNKAINEGKNFLISLYNDALKPLVVALFDAVTWFRENETILGLLAIVIGTVTALIIAYNIQQTLATANTTLWAVVAGGATAVTTALGAAFTFLTSPIALIILAIGAVIAIVWILVENWEAVAEWLKGLWQGIKDFFVGIWNAISDFFVALWSNIRDFFVGLWEGLVKFFEDVLNNIVKFFTWIWNGIRDFFMAIWNGLRDFIVGIWNGIKSVAESVWNAIKNFLTNTWNTIKNTVTSVFNAIAGFFSGIWNNITGIFRGAIDNIVRIFNDLTSGIRQAWDGVKRIFNGIIDFITGIFTGNWSKAWNGIKNIFGGVFDALTGLFKAPINFIIDGLNWFIRGLNKIKIPDWVPLVGGKGINIGEIPRLKVGMDYVPSDDFPAFLHKGEAVLTASEAERWRANMPRFGNGAPQFNSLAFAGAQQMINRIDLTATIEADGYTLGKVVLNNLDDVRGLG